MGRTTGLDRLSRADALVDASLDDAAPPTWRSIHRQTLEGGRPRTARARPGRNGRYRRAAVDRVNAKARAELGWHPKYDFAQVLQRLSAGEEPRSDLAVAVGAKGYHSVSTGPYTIR